MRRRTLTAFTGPTMMVGLLAVGVGAAATDPTPHPRLPDPGPVVVVHGGPLLVTRATYTDGHTIALAPGVPVPSAGVVTVVAVATSSPDSAPPGCVISVDGHDTAATAPAGQVATCRWPPTTNRSNDHD